MCTSTHQAHQYDMNSTHQYKRHQQHSPHQSPDHTDSNSTHHITHQNTRHQQLLHSPNHTAPTALTKAYGTNSIRDQQHSPQHPPEHTTPATLTTPDDINSAQPLVRHPAFHPLTDSLTHSARLSSFHTHSARSIQ